jgi:hypothetical protein
MRPRRDIAGGPAVLAVLLMGSLLETIGGCSSATSLSEDFGESMATAARVQRLPPRPVESAGNGSVLEGQPAARIMQGYIRSFDRSSSVAAPVPLAPATGSAGIAGQ